MNHNREVRQKISFEMIQLPSSIPLQTDNCQITQSFKDYPLGNNIRVKNYGSHYAFKRYYTHTHCPSESVLYKATSLSLRKLHPFLSGYCLYNYGLLQSPSLLVFFHTWKTYFELNLDCFSPNFSFHQKMDLKLAPHSPSLISLLVLQQLNFISVWKKKLKTTTEEGAGSSMPQTMRKPWPVSADSKRTTPTVTLAMSETPTPSGSRQSTPSKQTWDTSVMTDEAGRLSCGCQSRATKSMQERYKESWIPSPPSAPIVSLWEGISSLTSTLANVIWRYRRSAS